MEPSEELPLALELPPPGSRARGRALVDALRAAIVEGRLATGQRLPSQRALAASLGLGRNTVVAAYGLLQAEGYLLTTGAGGTCVAHPPRATPRRTATIGATRLAPFWRDATFGTEAPAAPVTVDFRLGRPDVSLLPADVWTRLATRCTRALLRTGAGYGDPAGQPALRQAIARHVAATRAVACSADDVIVTAGAQQAFDLLARVLVTPGRTVAALEDPGYPPLRAALQAQGALLVPVPVDDEGMVVDALPATARLVGVTPSHQFPLGVALSTRRRHALLAFARRHGAVVIEDDYDAEFRHGTRALDALQTLDRGENVFYVGTFSKSLFPALRLGYIVAPPWAQPALQAARRLADRQGNAVVQDTLAAFIAEGHLARHVRRMQRLYAQRRAALLQAVQRHGGARWRLAPSAAGLHVALLGRPGRVPAGVAVEPLERYVWGGAAARGWALSFALAEPAAAERALAALLAPS